MPTFQDAYCARHQCSADAFRKRVFWQALPPHARVFGLLFGGRNSRYFAADRSFISSVGSAESLHQVLQEIRDYFMDPQNRGWLRHRVRIRVSSKRIQQLVREHLPTAAAADLVGNESRPPLRV